MLLIVEKGIGGGISCNTLIDKSQQKMQDKECLYFMYWDVNNLYGWAMPQKLSVMGSKWRKEKFRYEKEFI